MQQDGINMLISTICYPAIFSLMFPIAVIMQKYSTAVKSKKSIMSEGDFPYQIALEHDNNK